MNKPIQVGDLVVVVRAHCDADLTLGMIRTVEELRDSRNWRCTACGKRGQFFGADLGAPPEGYSFARLFFPLSDLKRIPPLSELESEKRDEEIHA